MGSFGIYAQVCTQASEGFRDGYFITPWDNTALIVKILLQA